MTFISKYRYDIVCIMYVYIDDVEPCCLNNLLDLKSKLTSITLQGQLTVV